jgi:hypothetical protein
VIEIIDCAQGTPEWFQARLGIPTASNFAIVMREKGKGENGSSVQRAELLNKLAGELLTGEPMESYSNSYMERGQALEDEARTMYAFMRDAEPQQVGFIRNGQKGASPDSLIGANGGLEIKIAIPHIQIARLRRGTLPPEHKAQVQGNISVAEREFWDFTSYCPKLPPLIIRVYRDEAYIKHLEECIDIFNQELAQLVDYVRRYGRAEAA